MNRNFFKTAAVSGMIFTTGTLAPLCAADAADTGSGGKPATSAAPSPAVTEPAPATVAPPTAVPTVPLASSLVRSRGTNGKYGFKNADGLFIVPPAYDDVWPFREELARVELDKRFGFVDAGGLEVIPPRFDTATEFSDGISAVSQAGEIFSINKRGERVRSAQAISASPTPRTRTPRPPRSDYSVASEWFADMGVSGYVGDLGFVGVEFGGGFHFTQDDRLKLNVGFFFEVDPVRVRGAGFSYEREDYYGDWNWYNNGKINVDHTFIPFLLSWEHEFHLTEKFDFRIGPSVGVGILHASLSPSPNVDGIESSFASETKAVWLAGVNASLVWNITKRSDFSVYLELNGGFFWSNKTHIDFGEVELPRRGGGWIDTHIRESVRMTGAKIGLTFGCRF